MLFTARSVTLTLVVLAALLAGCGNSRTPVPSVTHPAKPDGFRRLTYTQAGIEFDVPRNWLVSTEHTALVATITSGTATVALWRYASAGGAQRVTTLAARLRAARAALIASAKARAPGLRVIHARVVTLAGLPGVVLGVTERIAGSLRRVRSIHLFAPGAELVIEEYAPPAIFDSVDHSVFSELERSLAPSGSSTP